MILIAPLRANGALLAKQAATLDVLSGGRLVLGVAVGGREDDFRASGVDFHARGRRFDAMLDQWARVWAGESFGTAGAIGPPPPRARPELLLGGLAGGDRARRPRHGDGWTAGAPGALHPRPRARARAWERGGARRRAAHGRSSPTSRSARTRERRPPALGDYYAFAGPRASRGSCRGR